MIHEFFGLPGSGKTYLAQKFSEECNVPLVEVRGRFEKYFWAFIFVCLRPQSFFVFLKEIFKENRHNTTLFRHKVHILFLNTIAKEGKALFISGDAVLDEGLLQAILSISERPLDQRMLTRFARLLGKRRIYFVSAPAETRGKRMLIRGRYPRSFLGEEYRRQWFAVLENNHKLIVQWSMKHFPCVTITNE